MSEKKMSEAQKKALEKYKAKVKRITVDFPPSELELWEHIQAQDKKQTYIKELIRQDMVRQKHKADLIRLQSYLAGKDATDISLAHNAGMDICPSVILEELTK